MFGGATITSYLFLGFLLALCRAQDQNLLYSRQEVNTDEEIFQCYDCNSAYDPRCGDPFDPYTIGVVNCSEKKVPEQLVNPLHMNQKPQSQICRKIVQRVEGKLRIIRSCGYTRDSHDDKKCFRRTGTSAIEVIHCSCTKKLCNAGQSLQRPIFIIILLAVVRKLAITSLLNGLL